MELMDAIRTRESVRRYLDKPVSEEALTRILDAGRLAPSAMNAQEWRFVVVRDADTRKALRSAANDQEFVGDAPVVLACCAETDERVMACGQLAYPVDVAIAVDHMALKAVEEGLGTCWIGSFHEDQVKDILGIPPQIRVVQLLTLGHPEHLRGKKKRRSLDEIVKYETWG